MRRYVGWSGAMALVVCSAVGLSGCGGGGGSNSTGAEPSEAGKTFVLDPVGTTSNSGTMTMGVSKTGLDANRADRLVVFARLLDPRGVPLVGVGVRFRANFDDARFQPSAEPDPRDGFPAGSGITDGDGVAQSTVIAPATPGRMAIVAEAGSLRLSGLIYVNVFDVGYIPGEGDAPTMIPTEITVSDPSIGSQLQFIVVGGTPFTAENRPPRGLASVEEPETGFVYQLDSVAQDVVLPYLLENPSSGIGLADLVFNGRFPASILYTLSGKVAGAHAFGVIDADGNSTTGTVTVEFTEVTITPESTTLEVGQTQALSLNGGVPPYSCTPSGGTLTPTLISERGGTTIFTPDEILRDATFTILCTDQAGQTVSASVSITPLPTPDPSSAPGGSPTPSAIPREATRVEVFGTPPTLNGPDGGTSTITARVLDQFFEPLAGVPVLFELAGESGEPTPTVPSISPTTGVTDGNGQAAVLLTVPEGTAPQFLIISAETSNGKTGQAQLGVTSQTTTPSGEPARISAALLRSDACQLNQDGTYTAIVSALVSDDNGNPVTTGVAVDWGPVTPEAFADVIGQSFTNAEIPCTVDQYKAGCTDEGLLLTISPQPGTATTCFTYALERAGQAASVTATITGTEISTTTTFTMPGPVAVPTPSPAPPVVTPTPGPPSLVPANATLDVGQTQTFAISGGVPPYSVSASGGTATPVTVPGSGGTFDYLAATVGNFTILVTDSNGAVASAGVNILAAVAIQVDKPGPLFVGFSATETITIVSGGTPPYTVTLGGGLGGSIIGSPLAGPGAFDYSAPGVPSAGTIVITDSAGPPNTLSISVAVP